MKPEKSKLTTTARGAAAETRALEYLCAQGLAPIARNFRAARGEIDLIMRDGATLVFVEVRARAVSLALNRYGGAAESIGAQKQARIVHAAQWFLTRRGWHGRYDCRFDVVAIDGDELQWIRGAFEA